MRRRMPSLAVVLAVMGVLPVVLTGQSAPKRASVARTSRDLGGYWTNATFIPLERPAEFAGKAVLTEAEAIAFQKKRELQENSQSKDDIHYDNVLWQTENYPKGTLDLRSSLISEPADGRVPPLTPEGQRRAATRAALAASRGSADAAQYRTLGERCI